MFLTLYVHYNILCGFPLYTEGVTAWACLETGQVVLPILQQQCLPRCWAALEKAQKTLCSDEWNVSSQPRAAAGSLCSHPRTDALLALEATEILIVWSSHFYPIWFPSNTQNYTVHTTFHVHPYLIFLKPLEKIQSNLTKRHMFSKFMRIDV